MLFNYTQLLKFYSCGDGWMNERMNEQTNERMNEWMNKEMNEWMNEQMNKQMNEWTNKRMNEQTNEWMNEQTNEWMNENEWIRHIAGMILTGENQRIQTKIHLGATLSTHIPHGLAFFLVTADPILSYVADALEKVLPVSSWAKWVGVESV